MSWRNLDLRAAAAFTLLLACDLDPVTPVGDAAPGGTDAGAVDAQSDLSPVLRACVAYAERTFPCREPGASVTLDDWISYRCSETWGGRLDENPAACKEALRLYWECALQRPDACAEEPGPCATDGLESCS